MFMLNSFMFGQGAPAGPSETALPTYVASGTLDGVNATGPTAPATLPSGWQAGDYHILQVTSQRTAAISAPSGWTLLAEVDGVDAIGDDRLTAFGRVAQGGDTTVNVTRNGSFITVRVHGFRGVFETTPTEGVASASDQGVALAFPSITTTGPNRLIVGMTSLDSCSGYTNANLASITERSDGSPPAAGRGQCMFTGTKAAAGAIGVTTCNGPNDDGFGLIILALRPA